MYYVLSVGTNIGDRQQNIEKCKEAINLLPKTTIFSSSAVYETEPVGYDQQQNFYNCVVLVNSKLNPGEMLGACLGIEAGFGRQRGIKNGPRVLDVDVIFAENMAINTKNLVLPHPRYHTRRFVLEPMLDIFTDGKAFGIDFKQYISQIEGQKIKKIN